MAAPATDPLVDARSELETRIRHGRLRSADDLRADFPAVWSDTESRLELVYAEYVLRAANGEAPDRADWCRRYPDMSERLERLFGLYDLMAGHDTAGGGPSGTVSVGGKRPAASPAEHPDGYEILGEIGRGGMAVVYKARQRGLNRVVAVKVLRGGGGWLRDEDAARVRREAEAVARLQHPHVVQIHEVGEWDGEPFLALEFVPGGTLADALARQHRLGTVGIPSDTAAALVETLARAMQHAHEQNIVHRDLKPANVLLADGPGGAFAHPKIADFGLAVAAERDSSVSQSAALVGTPSYMAPEQANSQLTLVGPRTDVYALGGILYELLTGRPPFQGATVLETLDLVRQAEPVRPRLLRPAVPRDVETICLKCLSKDPARRYGSAAALADDLARFRDGRPITARPVGVFEQGWKWCRRRPLLAGLAAGLVAAVALGTAGVALEYRRAESERLSAVDRLKQIELINESVFDIFTEFDIEKVKADDKPVEYALAQRLIEAGKKLDADAIRDPLVLANLRNRLGVTLLSLGEAPAAIDLLTASLEVRTAHLGPDHSDTLTTTGNLANGYLAAGQLERAVPLFEEAYTRSQAALGPEHSESLTATNNLASGRLAAGRHDQAIPLLNDSLTRHTAKFGADHPLTLVTTGHLAMAYQAAGESDEALPLLERVFDRTQARFGPDHPDTLQALNNLALCSHEAGKPDQALPLYERVLAGRKRVCGPDHPHTLTAMNNLASGFQDTGKLDKAVPLFAEALALKKAKYAPGHPSILTSMANLAMAHHLAGNLDKAVTLHEETLAARETKLGPHHPHTLITMNNLASAYQHTRQLDKAVPLFAEVFARQKVELGPDHPGTLTSMNNLALCHRDAGESDKSLGLHEEVLALQKAKEGPDHPDTHWYMSVLATGYDAAGQFDKAEVLHRDRLASAAKTAGRDSPAYATAAGVYGRSLLLRKKWADAVPLLRDCLAVREVKQPDHWQTWHTRSMLGGALAGLEKNAEAEPLLLRGYEGMKAREAAIPKAGGPEVFIPEALDRLIALHTATLKPDEAKKFQTLRAEYPPVTLPPKGKK